MPVIHLRTNNRDSARIRLACGNRLVMAICISVVAPKMAARNDFSEGETA